MAGWRRIDTRIWNDEKFASLPDRAKLTFFFVVTHPHLTSLGAMRATIPGMAAELGWDVKDFREAFAEAFRKGLLEHDERANYVGVKNFLKYHPPQSPNVVKSWNAALDLIPECELKSLLLQRVKDFLEDLPEAFTKAFGEGFRKTSPNKNKNKNKNREGATLPDSDAPQEKEKPKRRAPRFDPKKFPLPDNLNTSEFQAAWQKWCRYRTDRKKPITEQAAEQTLKDLARLPAADAIEFIETAITNGWTGCAFPDKIEKRLATRSQLQSDKPRRLRPMEDDDAA